MSKCPGLHCPGCGDGGFPWELVAALAAVVGVVLFVLAHLVLIAAGLAVAAVVTGAAVWFLRRFMVAEWNHRAPRAALHATVTAEAISAAQRPAIEAPALHIHFHGISAEAAAAIIAPPARFRP